ncbi:MULTISPECIES: tetratricopeptide repeat protein [Acidobacteriaceae]|uniref:tetratricopeptide repeat protein n=1 Tax=Acidobacteriaceae TaxID=204434 RepID=UPI00131A6F07|nr:MULTISPECIES: tetratricopeptide repeat protein [Acidobacteriaceae]MDW5264595.1 tetratricopeptide repeat protein [Edaphobacter sp.]
MKSFFPFRFVVLLLVGMGTGYFGSSSFAAAQQANNTLSTSNQADALVAQALHSLQQGDQSTAQQLLLQAIAISPTNASTNNALGKLYSEEHRYPEAMERFEAVLAINLRDADARRGELSAAVALALQVRAASPEAALACLQHARENLPDDPTLLIDLGIQAQGMNQLVLANESLSAALKVKPDDLTTLYALARVETDQMHSELAEKHFREYLAARPDDATAHYGLGHLLQMQLKTAEATKEFKRSIELQPVQTESYYALGQIALDTQHDAEAEPLFHKTLARDPNHGGALTGMGILSYRAKNYAEAEGYLAKAIVSAPNYQPARYYYSLALAHVGKKAEAEQQLKIAASLQQKRAIPITPGTQ